jgi:dihydropteroate synthase
MDVAKSPYGNPELFNPASVQVMGVINTTPDSFSDGGLFFDSIRAVEQGLKLAEEGADILDIGGESTRPGAEPVDETEEIRRVIPVITALAENTSIPISIDTYKSNVAKEAVSAGASIVNDISAMTFDPDMARIVAESGCDLILMHILGTPRDMQRNPVYDNLLEEIATYLRGRVDFALKSGISQDKIWVDPGIGFGKRQTEEHRDNFEILAHLPHFRGIGSKLVVGTSRKSFIGKALGGVSADARLYGGLGTFAWSALFGADVLRVHDVAPTIEMLKLMSEIYSSFRKEGRL